MDRTQYEKDLKTYFDSLPESSFEEAHCPFCGPEGESLELFQKGTMRVHRCSCWFVYNKRQPTQEALNEFYSRSDAMKTWATLKASDGERLRQEEKFSIAISSLTRARVRSVLDIGCGNGSFLAQLLHKDPSIDAVGIDTSPAAVEYALNQGVHASVQTIDDFFKGTTRTFDAISLWGVLEHVKSPIHLLKAVHEKLNPGGYVVVCVPNVESLIVRATWTKCFTFCPQHLWYFSTDRLIEAYHQAGFILDDRYYIEPERKPLARALAGFDPYARLPEEWEDWLPQPVGMDPERFYKMVFIGKKVADVRKLA